MKELKYLYPNYYSPVIKMIKIYLQKGKINEAKMLTNITNFENATHNTKKLVDNLKNYENNDDQRSLLGARYISTWNVLIGLTLVERKYSQGMFLICKIQAF